MSELSLEEKVRSWLAQQGYPFELRVGKVFDSGGWLVDYSRFYTDPTTSKAREIDVYASNASRLHDGFIGLNVVVECKTSAEKPWIVLSSKRGFSHYGTELPVGAIANECIAWFGHTHEDGEQLQVLASLPHRIGHGIVRAFSESKSGDPSAPYAGVQTAVNAVVMFASEVDETEQEDWLLTVDIGVPLVLLEGRLFDYWIDDDGTAKLEEVTRSCILVPNPLAPSQVVFCHLLTTDGLEEWLSALSSDLKLLSRRLSGGLSEIIARARKRRRET